MMRTKFGLFCALSMSLAFAISCADSPGTGDDDQQQGQTTCGDGTCDASEATSCPTDCGQNSGSNNNSSYTCGNGQCETTKGENAQNCGYDCNQNGNGSGSGSGQTSGSCPSDPNACIGCLLDSSQCPAGLDANGCLQCVLNGGGLGSGSGSGFGSCEGGIPDGTCNAAAGEDATTCPFDCM